MSLLKDIKQKMEMLFVKSGTKKRYKMRILTIILILFLVELLPTMEQEGVIEILVNSIRDTRFNLQLLIGCLQSCAICGK